MNDPTKLPVQPSKTGMEFVLTSYLESIEKISRKIASIEEKLNQANLNVNYIYVLFSETKISENSHLILIDHCLVLEKNAASIYQLNYNTYQNLKEASGKTLDKSLVSLSTQRLIDAPSKFRIKIAKELTVFYQKVSSIITSTTNEGLIIHYSLEYTQIS